MRPFVAAERCVDAFIEHSTSAAEASS